MIKHKFAKLNDTQIQDIKALEQSLGEDIQIFAIEKQPVFVVEAKTAPNCWERIKEIYPGVGFQSYYSTKDEALAAKATLKHLLLGRLKGQFQKYPIRIRETS